MFKRDIFPILAQRVMEPRRLIQIVLGPRQVGKTTLMRQLQDELTILTQYASADASEIYDQIWMEQQWEIARVKLKEDPQKGVLLILDEIQKIGGWSDVVKRFWDEDSWHKRNIKVILLGSAQLLLQKGMSDSLAGRFEVIRAPHWSYKEMKEAFGWSFEQYIYFGGYPGSAPLISNESRWREYISNALIETTLSKDILQMTRVNKPSLLKNLFLLGCRYSGQILSYQKILGQLQDAGNTTTLAHYMNLLANAGLLTGLDKYAVQGYRQRGSSPKWQVFNTALLTTLRQTTFEQIKSDRDNWGRLVESAIGAYLVNSTQGTNTNLYYWRDRGKEVDFILQRDNQILPIEVKSGLRKTSLSGIKTFCESFKVKKFLLVGGNGIPIEEFLLEPLERWFE